MLKTYFKIAWRNIVRNKVYTLINVLGLSLGICACIVVYLLTDLEFSYDRFHPDKERIYRIVGGLERSNGEKEFLNSPFRDVANVEHEVRGFEFKAAIQFLDGPVSVPGEKAKRFNEGKIVATVPEYFDIFTYTWLAGDRVSALKDPYRVVLTNSQARKYFGNISFKEMLNKTVIYQDSLQVSVAGIVQDWEKRSDLAYTDFISLSTAPNTFLRDQIPTADWASLHPHRSMAFVKLDKTTSREQIDYQLEAIRKKVKPSDFGRLEKLYLQALSELHFTNDYYRADDGDGFRKAHLPTLYLLMALCLFILGIAAINFINLSTAQAIQRIKEVGVRKVMGGSRWSLIVQFLVETFAITLLAVALSILLVRPVISLFDFYLPSEVQFDSLQPATLLFLAGLTAVTTIFAGFYPAKVLSSYLPVVSLKGESAYPGNHGSVMRKGLIVFQFSMSLIFIIAGLVIQNQITYMQEKDKGFKTDAILIINSWSDKTEKLKLLKEKLSHITGVENVILQGTAPMGRGEMTTIIKYKGTRELTMEIDRKIGNQDFIPFYGMKLLAGTNLGISDSIHEYVINEAYARALGFQRPEEAVGKFLFAGNVAIPIVGVVADFHQSSFHQAIKPAIIEKAPEWQRNLAVKLTARGKHNADIQATIANMEKSWKAIFPEENFDYTFLDDYIGWLFDGERQTAWLINVAMIITIFISCIGLFGLAMFMAQKRTKEIGIRKVLGASVANIAAMLGKDFARLVFISIVLASPIAWYIMKQWLQGYVYRTAISWRIFVVSGGIAFVISLATVSFQSIKAAMANPVKSLRSE